MLRGQVKEESFSLTLGSLPYGFRVIFPLAREGGTLYIQCSPPSVLQGKEGVFPATVE